MSVIPRRRIVLGVAVAAALVAACTLPETGKLPALTSPGAGVPERLPGYGLLQTQPELNVQTGAPQGEAGELPFPFLNRIGLSESQIGAIRTLLQNAEKGASPPSQQEGQQRSQAFETAMSGQTVDEAALRGFFTQMVVQSRAQITRFTALLDQIRNVLTPAQQTAAAAEILREAKAASPAPAASAATEPGGTAAAAAAASPAAMPGDLGPDLHLTPEQAALFKATQPPRLSDTAVAEALAAFLSDGDTQALTAALTPTTSVSDEVQALVTAYASLSYAQRQTLLNWRPPSPPPSAPQTPGAPTTPVPS